MNIVKVVGEYLEESTDIIFDTEIGKKYYPNRMLLYKEIEKGQLNDEFYVIKNDQDELQGVLWYQQEGMFHSFPYLHMIAIKKECQNHGMGGKLLDFFEKQVLIDGKNHMRTKIFLTVGDFNENAEQVYIHRGYKKLCDLDALFRRNITEKLYMKVVLNNSDSSK